MVDEDDTVGQWVAYYREQIEQSRAVAASMDLDTPVARTDISSATSATSCST